MTEDEIMISEQAQKSANDIRCLLSGRDMASSYIALGMVIGKIASEAARPDLHGVMPLITEQAFQTYLNNLEVKRRG